MIYKYSPFSCYALENQRLSQVFCRHFSDFNDPFEFWSVVEEGEPDPDQDPMRYRRALEAWDFLEAEYDDVREYFEEIRDYQDNFHRARENTRISCFSREADNLLMWSHYADGLRGICLELDEKALLAKDEDAQIIDVQYTKSPGFIDAFESPARSLPHTVVVWSRIRAAPSFQKHSPAASHSRSNWTAGILDDRSLAESSALESKNRTHNRRPPAFAVSC
ncbi:DUF2971 domain-containing protein [Ruegeria arenilitoris]|uniref:DUF2971 domain-containing protein n=1 Tax=Ruegeria arenilitoris TaxID=1173585 RepID=UPI003C7BEE5F